MAWLGPPAVAGMWHGLSRTAGAKTFGGFGGFGDPFWILRLDLFLDLLAATLATPVCMAWLQRLAVSAEIPPFEPRALWEGKNDPRRRHEAPGGRFDNPGSDCSLLEWMVGYKMPVPSRVGMRYDPVVSQPPFTHTKPRFKTP